MKYIFSRFNVLCIFLFSRTHKIIGTPGDPVRADPRLTHALLLNLAFADHVIQVERGKSD